MSSDNDPRDDAMREIEAALEVLIDRAAVGRGVADQRVKVRALIRSKLPQPTADAGGWGEDDDRFRQNEEHERAVEAWKKRAMGMTNAHRMFLLERLEIDEALRLMRARPASDWEQRFYALADKVKCRAPSCGDIDCGLGEIDDKLEAAGELLRAAKDAWPWVYGHPKQSDELWQAIAKAERAGIKPQHQD